MRRTVTLRYPATCADCGAELAAGEKARYYGPYRVYGIGCHARSDPATRPKRRPSRMLDYERERAAMAEDIALEDALSRNQGHAPDIDLLNNY